MAAKNGSAAEKYYTIIIVLTVTAGRSIFGLVWTKFTARSSISRITNTISRSPNSVHALEGRKRQYVKYDQHKNKFYSSTRLLVFFLKVILLNQVWLFRTKILSKRLRLLILPGLFQNTDFGILQDRDGILIRKIQNSTGGSLNKKCDIEWVNILIQVETVDLHFIQINEAILFIVTAETSGITSPVSVWNICSCHIWLQRIYFASVKVQNILNESR